MSTLTAADSARIDSLLDRVVSDLHAINPAAAANLEHDLAQSEDRIVQTFSVTTRRDGVISFQSNLTDSEVLESLRRQNSQFAQDLARKFNKLSASQYAWAHKLAVDAVKKQQDDAVVDNTESGVQALFSAFEAAKAKGAKRLTLRFQGINVKPNRDLTALWVTSQTETEEGRYGLQPKYLGKVTRTGIDSRMDSVVRETIMAVASDPLTAAVRYGKVSGECSCCGRELTDSRSIEAGIGPVCARKFGW